VDARAAVFNALGNPVRLRILLTLMATTRPLHIKAVAERLALDYASVYRHVKRLTQAGLLDVYEVGRSRVLALRHDATLRELLAKALDLTPST
jgi:DNA-binding transcriptional ArsR family regulator